MNAPSHYHSQMDDGTPSLTIDQVPLEWCIAPGVKIVGTDGWSWDAPFLHTQKRYALTKDAALIWEGHFAGSVTPYCQIEKLANLALLPPTGFTVISLPVKVAGASAGWARPVALLN